jgi:glucose/arabinose dehydrogenase
MPRAAVFFALLAFMASAPRAEPRLEGVAAFGDWRSDAPGVRRHIAPADLPKPYATASSASRAHVIPPPAGATPRGPEGFSVSKFAQGLKGPRRMAFSPNGDLFTVESDGGLVRVFRLDATGTKPEKSEVFASGLDRPYGIAFYPPGGEPGYVYVATASRVLRYPYKTSATAPLGPAEFVVKLPGAGHWTRDIVFSAEGKKLFAAVGSRSNDAEDESRPSKEEVAALEAKSGVGASGGAERRRADVLVFAPDGSGEKVFATGLRNCSGVTIRPESDELWCVVNERDGLGDDLPPDYATQVKQGGFYGWPWYYIGAHEDPSHAGARPELADKVATPDVLIQSHSAPLGIVFYEGAQFPPSYKGDAFVALHGSWNRSRRTGYKVVRLLFKDGKPTGEYEDFLTGFVLDEDHVFGRPVGVTVAPDGALLVCEDGNGIIWRVSWSGGEGSTRP